MRTPTCRTASIAILALLVSAPLLAQGSPEAFAGRTITGVRLVLDARPLADDAEYARVLETQVGRTLSSAEVRESIVHLMALGRFEDVRVRGEGDGRGVRLTYELVPLRSVKDIVFRGEVALSVRQLRSEVTARYGASPPAARANEIARDLETFYRDRGFPRASVKPSVERRPGDDHAQLVFDVAAGPRAVIGEVDIQGAPGGAPTPVAQRLALQPGVPFDLVAMRQRFTEYVEELRSRGFVEAKVEFEPTYSPDQDRVDLSVKMNRGPRVSIVFRGDPLPATRKDEAAAIRREGTIDEDMLENEERSLEDELRAQGFRDAEASYTREAVGPEDVQIVFTVKRGPQYRVARVEVAGNRYLSRAAFQPSLRLVPGEWFVKSRLDADLATIAERYRREGFKDVKVLPAVTPEPGRAASLVVVLTVTEGPQTRIESLDVLHNNVIDTATLRRNVQSRPGGPFYEPALSADRDAIVMAYLNRGYQLVNVDAQATFTENRAGATVRFVISEGPQIRVDHVLVVGNVRTKASTIEREMGLRKGMPLSLQELAQGQSRLNALGLFRRVRVTELQRGSETERDVLVVVEEAPPNTVGYGAGLEGSKRLKRDQANAVERFDLSPRGFVEYGRRNLWGGNRSVNLFARAAIRGSDQANADGGESPEDDGGPGFREYRVLATFREPKLMGSGIDLAVTGVGEQAIRSSFDFRRQQAIVEGSHSFGRTLTLAARYSLGRTTLFNDRIDAEDRMKVDRLFGESGVRLSSFSTSLRRNTVDDPFDPSRGTLFLLDGTLAARRLGSQVGFMKGTAQAFGYRAVPALGKTVLAAGVRLGLATGFAQLTPEGEKLQELPASERFFAGGDNTVRGFAQDRLGARGVLDRRGVSLGGNALLVMNGELRFPLVTKINLGGAAFVDVGNVFARVNDFDLGDLRTGAGFGLRWKSPVGPLRIDLGWKTTRRTFENGTREPRFSYHFSIGQAF